MRTVDTGSLNKITGANAGERLEAARKHAEAEAKRTEAEAKKTEAEAKLVAAKEANWKNDPTSPKLWLTFALGFGGIVLLLIILSLIFSGSS